MHFNSFQQARLAEQLRLSTKQQHEELSTSSAIAAPKNDDSAVESKESRDIPEELLEFEAKEARENYLLDLEAPMMTYEKYLTMQVCVCCTFVTRFECFPHRMNSNNKYDNNNFIACRKNVSELPSATPPMLVYVHFI